MLQSQWLSPPKVAKLLGTGTEKIIRFIAEGELVATNISHGIRPRWRIALSDVESLMKRRSNQATVKPAQSRRRPIPTPTREYV